MTFAEKLERARTGSKSAYESLCLSCTDSLYTAALIALKSENAAKSAVISAISDGYAGISRIRDERHLRSWLVHELTKNAVDKLKEMRSGGVSAQASGVFAETGKLADVERLIFAVSASFGYGSREISVLTGMSEDAVSEKLRTIKNKLGAENEKIRKAAASFTAPESLKSRYRAFDEGTAAATAGRPAPEPVRDNKPEKSALPEIPTMSASANLPDEEHDIMLSDTVQLDALNDNENGFDGDESVFEEEDADTVGNDAAVNTEFDASGEDIPDVYMDDDITIAGGGGDEKQMSDAETFIAVVSAEKMKGSEFLRLIGNTRISNSVYREIEQNPRLTKKRLIELLEQSPLTSEDYYKLLTAVKHRREVIDAKEENRRALEKAGLFDAPRERRSRRRREPPKTELQMAIEMSDAPKKNATMPLTLDNEHSFSDSTDYEIQNAAGEYSRKRTYEKIKDTEEQNGIGDLGSVVSEAARRTGEKAYRDPLTDSAVHDIFDEIPDEAVDPFAAIAANETGLQAKPDRIDRPFREEHTAPAPDISAENDSSGTREFDVNTAAADIQQTEDPAGTAEPALPADSGSPHTTDAAAAAVMSAGGHDAAAASAAADAAAVTAESRAETRRLRAADRSGLPAAAPRPVSSGPESEAGFSPELDLDFGEDDEPYDATAEIPKITPDVRDAADNGSGDGDDDGDFSEAPKRQRYKGNEFFYDDDKYYEGVNRGKIIFCVICAILLTAGAMGMKFIGGTNGSGDVPPAVSTQSRETAYVSDDEPSAPQEDESFSEEASFTALSSYDELFSDRYSTDEPAVSPDSGTTYLSADGKPYDPLIREKKNDDNVLETKDMMYIYSGQRIRAVKLDPEEPQDVGQADIDSARYIGMTELDGSVYVISEDVCGNSTQYAVRVDIYDSGLNKTGEYTLSGSFAGAGIIGGKLAVATNFSPAAAKSIHSSLTYGSTLRFDTEKPYFANDDKLTEISTDKIYAIDGASYNGMTLIGTVGTDTAAAVAGGSTLCGFADIREDGVTVLRPDDGCTYAAELSASLEAVSVKKYMGLAFSAECAGKDGMVGYTAASGTSAYKGGKLISSGIEGEAPKGVSWSPDGIAYVVAEGGDGSAMLYGFGMSGETPAASGTSADNIVTRKLAKAGDMLTGLKAEASADGERIGLRLSVYTFDGKLTEKAYTIIGLDENTGRENLKYLSSPAEKSCLNIACDESGTTFAVPTVYFDGFSEVERIVILKYDGSGLAETDHIITYDEKSDVMCLCIRDGKLFAVTDDKVTVTDLSASGE